MKSSNQKSKKKVGNSNKERPDKGQYFLVYFFNIFLSASYWLRWLISAFPISWKTSSCKTEGGHVDKKGRKGAEIKR